MDKTYKYQETTQQIIGAAYKVHNSLGAGFLEKVYENALAIELRNCGLSVAQQSQVEVRYQGQIVGSYVADLIVADKIVVEMKAISKLEKAHEAQLVNCLKATGMPVGLLINFGRSVEVRRRIFDQDVSV